MADEQIANRVCRIHETPNYKQMRWCMPNHFLSTGLRVCLVSTSVYLSLYINLPAPTSTYWLPRWAKLFKRKWQVAALACSVQWKLKTQPKKCTMSHSSWSAPIMYSAFQSFFFLFVFLDFVPQKSNPYYNSYMV